MDIFVGGYLCQIFMAVAWLVARGKWIGPNLGDRTDLSISQFLERGIPERDEVD